MKNKILGIIGAFVVFAPVAENAIPITIEFDSGSFTQLPSIPAGLINISGTFTADLPESGPTVNTPFPLFSFLFTDNLNSTIDDTLSSTVASSFTLDSDDQVDGFILKFSSEW